MTGVGEDTAPRQATGPVLEPRVAALHDAPRPRPAATDRLVVAALWGGAALVSGTWVTGLGAALRWLF